MKIELDQKTATVIILILVALFSLVFLGFTGFKVIFGVLLVFFLPFYFILDNFELAMGEKVFFSFFIGLGIFPAIVYWLGTLISFRLSIIIAFVLLIGISFLVKKYKRTNDHNNSRD